MDISDAQKLMPSETEGEGPMAHMFDALTRKEQMVLGGLIFGAEYKEIARSLSISPATVCDHAKAIFEKLEIHDRALLFYTAFGDATEEGLEVLEGLTPDQKEVATLLLQGLSREQAARLKSISESRMKDHIKGIFNTLGIHRMADLYLAVHIHDRPPAPPAASRPSSSLVPD